MAKRRRFKREDSADWAVPIVLTAGTLQHALRTEQSGFRDRFAKPMGGREHVLSLLALVPPIVWRPNSDKGVYKVGGMRDLTRAMVSRLEPTVSVPCLQFQSHVATVSTSLLGMLARRFVTETQFEEWLAIPDNWRNWFLTDEPDGAAFGKVFGVSRQQGYERLCNAQVRAVQSGACFVEGPEVDQIMHDDRNSNMTATSGESAGTIESCDS